MEHLRDFYVAKESGVSRATGLWHIQMLLVFACGKSILAREATPSGHTGMNFFAPAIEGLPDIRALQNEPILAIEVLCLVSLFLEASDIRSGSWGYVCYNIASPT
jgi:proline utilization trans-activator